MVGAVECQGGGNLSLVSFSLERGGGDVTRKLMGWLAGFICLLQSALKISENKAC